MLKCQFRIAAHWLTGCRHSLWWGRSGLSWTASEPWSRHKSQRTRWRTSGWCQARSRRSLRPAPLRTSSTASWSGLPRWHSLAAETRTKKKKRRSLKPTICGEKQLHELSDLQFLTSKKKKGHHVPNQYCLSRRRDQGVLKSSLVKRNKMISNHRHVNYSQYHIFRFGSVSAASLSPTILPSHSRHRKLIGLLRK